MPWTASEPSLGLALQLLAGESLELPLPPSPPPPPFLLTP